jgi:hypothetical protein
MTVSEMIEWLKTQDQGATVDILCGQHGRGYEGDSYSRVYFDPKEHAEYTDMRGNQFAKGTPYENERTLFLGYYE